MRCKIEIYITKRCLGFELGNVFGESFKVDEINLQLIRLNHRRKMFLNFKDNAFFVFKNEIFYLCKIMNGIVKIYKRLKKEVFKDFVLKFSFDTINRIDLAIEQKRNIENPKRGR